MVFRRFSKSSRFTSLIPLYVFTWSTVPKDRIFVSLEKFYVLSVLICPSTSSFCCWILCSGDDDANDVEKKLDLSPLSCGVRMRELNTYVECGVWVGLTDWLCWKVLIIINTQRRVAGRLWPHISRAQVHGTRIPHEISVTHPSYVVPIRGCLVVWSVKYLCQPVVRG